MARPAFSLSGSGIQRGRAPFRKPACHAFRRRLESWSTFADETISSSVRLVAFHILPADGPVYGALSQPAAWFAGWCPNALSQSSYLYSFRSADEHRVGTVF